MAELIYQAGLRISDDPLDPNDRPKPIPPIVGADFGPLQLIQSPEQPGSEDTRNAETSGLKLTLVRTDNVSDQNPIGGERKDNCYVGAVVSGLPTDLRFFKVRATFEAPTWETTDATYGWAAVVFAREKGASYPTRDQRTTVTLASSKDAAGVVAAKLNTPGGAPPDATPPFAANAGVAPKPIAELARRAIYGLGSARFTIELLVDRVTKRGRAGLETKIFGWLPYRERRWFAHPLIMDDANEIDTAGFSLAIASGIGTASIEVHDFRVYRLSALEALMIRFGAIWPFR
jgi:hypothetical protein